MPCDLKVSDQFMSSWGSKLKLTSKIFQDNLNSDLRPSPGKSINQALDQNSVGEVVKFPLTSLKPLGLKP